MDSISNLPDEVLDFDDKTEEEEVTGFSNFVDKTLALSSPINKFSLNCACEYDGSRVNRWIRTALERGCLELNLIYSKVDVLIDSALFTSNKLVKLTISDGFFLNGGGVFLPSLKTLSLVSVSFDMVKFFIHGCPKLEELLISVLLGYSRVTLKAPNLDDSTCGYRLLSDSLVKARLDFQIYNSDDDEWWDDIYWDVTTLIKRISNIKTLHLSPHCEVIFFSWYPMPVLDNLLNLSIESDKGKGWELLPHLLENSPNLQILVIKGLVHRVTGWCGDACPCIRMKDCIRMEYWDKVCCLPRCRVKVLEISGYRGSFRELKQMRHFLRKLKYLETVKIGIEEDMKNLRANLMVLPRASSKCKIQFI